MSALVGFIVGYVVGARNGGAGFDRVEHAAREIRESDEFRRFMVALRAHVRETAQLVGERLRSQIGPELTRGTEAPR